MLREGYGDAASGICPAGRGAIARPRPGSSPAAAWPPETAADSLARPAHTQVKATQVAAFRDGMQRPRPSRQLACGSPADGTFIMPGPGRASAERSAAINHRRRFMNSLADNRDGGGIPADVNGQAVARGGLPRPFGIACGEMAARTGSLAGGAAGRRGGPVRPRRLCRQLPGPGNWVS